MVLAECGPQRSKQQKKCTATHVEATKFVKDDKDKLDQAMKQKDACEMLARMEFNRCDAAGFPSAQEMECAIEAAWMTKVNCFKGIDDGVYEYCANDVKEN